MAQVIKQQFPNAHVAMLIRTYTKELVEDNEFVDQILYYDEDDGVLTPFAQLVSSLRSQKFDVVIHTQPRPRLAWATWFAAIPVRVGTGYRWYSFLFNKKMYEHRKTAQRHELEYNLQLLSVVGCSVDGLHIQPSLIVHPESTNRVNNILERLGIQPEERVVVLHPGSGGSARDWSAKKFGELAQRLGNIPNVRVVITGKKNEEQLVNTVMNLAGTNAVPLINFESLRDFAAIAKRATLFVANSTGPIHIAAAVGTYVIGLYPQITALSAARWSPYTNAKTIFSPDGKPADCKKCLQATTCECMETISVEDVYQKVKRVLGKS